MRALFVSFLAISLSLAACKSGLDDGFAVALTIEPGDVMPAQVASLTFTVSGNETFSQNVPLTAPFAKGHEALLYRPLASSKSLRFDVAALDAQQNALGSGFAMVTLEAGKTVSATVTLSSMSSPADLAGDSSVDGGPDLASPKMLTVSLDGAAMANGKVVDATSAISCGSTCSASFTAGSMVTLTASRTLKTGTWFSKWGGDCASSGNQPTCTLTMDGAKTVTATFDPVNYMFVTSATTALPLGADGAASLVAADARCAQLANSHLPGTRWKAWLSVAGNGTGGDPLVHAKDHLAATTARGWVRADDLPFADTVSSLITTGVSPLVSGKVLYPALRDELGDIISISAKVATGTTSFGTLENNDMTANCLDWTSNNGANKFSAGAAGGGANRWTEAYLSASAEPCSSAVLLYCFGADYTTTLVPPMADGRKAFVSIGVFDPSTGVATANTLCQNEATTAGLANASTFKAMLATSNPAKAASELFNSAAGTKPWVRVDGIPLVANAADLFNPAGTLLATFDVRSDGQGWGVQAYTGATSQTQQGAPGTTCTNWSSNLMTDNGSLGYAPFLDSNFFFNGAYSTCDQKRPVYCLEP